MDGIFKFLFLFSHISEVITNTEVINSNITEHVFSPTTIITDKRRASLLQVIKEVVAAILGFMVEHTTMDDDKTIGMLERTSASLGKGRKTEAGEQRSMWRKFFSFSVPEKAVLLDLQKEGAN